MDDDFLPRPRPRAERRAGDQIAVDAALQKNINAFCAQLDGLLSAHAGKYVIFADEALFQVCSSLASALTVGYAKFGAGPFLVQRVEPIRSHIDFQATCQV